MAALLSICCLHCFKFFDGYDRKPFIGTCAHSVCAPCFAKLQNASCPICKKEDAFKEKRINYGALAIMNDLALKLCGKSDYSQLENLEEAYTEGLCIKCKEYSKKLRLCADCNPECFEEDEHGRMEQNVRTLRKFVTAKHVSICAGCASDHHDGHRIQLLKAEEGMFYKESWSIYRQRTIRFMPMPTFPWGPFMVVIFKQESLEMKDRIRWENGEFDLSNHTDSIQAFEKDGTIKWERLYDRKLLYLEAEIKEFVEHFNQLFSNEQDVEKKANLEKMIRILEEILTAIPGNLLTKMSAEEVAELDAELEQKMNELEANVIAEHKVLIDERKENQEEKEEHKEHDARVERENDYLVEGVQQMKLAEPKEDPTNNKPRGYLIDRYDLGLHELLECKNEEEYIAEGVEIMARSPRYPKYVVIIRERKEALERMERCYEKYTLASEQLKEHKRCKGRKIERFRTTRAILNDTREAIGEEIYAEEMRKLEQEQRMWSQTKFDLADDISEANDQILEAGCVHLMTLVWERKYFPRKTTNDVESAMFFTMLLD